MTQALLNRRIFSYRAAPACIAIALLALLGACSSTGGLNAAGIQGASAASSPNDIFVLSARAREAYQQSRWIEAVALYQRVVEQVPNDADAWFRLGNTYAQQGNLLRAINAYERSLQNNHEQPKAWFNLSIAYLLNAQSAMRSAYQGMRPNDPARAMINSRLNALADIVHGRIEENDAALVSRR